MFAKENDVKKEQARSRSPRRWTFKKIRSAHVSKGERRQKRTGQLTLSEEKDVKKDQVSSRSPRR